MGSGADVYLDGDGGHACGMGINSTCVSIEKINV